MVSQNTSSPLRPSAPVTPGACDAGSLHSRNLPAIFRLALRLHDERRFREAQQIYHRILETDPTQADALHLLGVLHHQLGEHRQAMDLLSRAAALKQSDASFFRHLGEVYRALLRIDEAIQSFQRALELDPESVDSLCNLGHALLQRGSPEEAEEHYRRALAGTQDDSELLTFLGVSLLHQAKVSEAQQCFRLAVGIDGGTVEARHMLAAITGVDVTEMPVAYVVELFDRYAESFDAHLVQRLRYRAPQLLREALERVTPLAGACLRIADLGCGTGLCGEVFRDVAGRFTGVDLSPRMLDVARKRGVYDELIVGDVTVALDERQEPVDLVLAADVFPYVGDLTEVLERCSATLGTGGLLAFTTELSRDKAVALQMSGRFAHNEQYVRGVAEGCGLEVVLCEEASSRIERNEPLEGQVYVLRRR